MNREAATPAADDALRLRHAIERALDAHGENRCAGADEILDAALATQQRSEPAGLDVERLAQALDVLSDEGLEYGLMAPEEREERTDAAERLVAEYARLSEPKP